MKNILITGATGFIGRKVVGKCLQQGYKVTICGRNEEKTSSMAKELGIKALIFDIYEKRDNWYEYTNCPDILIHLAWGGLTDYKSLNHIEIQLLAQYIFLKNMIISGLRNLTVAGTCLEYGMQEGALKESLSTIPAIPYGLAKDCLRRFLEMLKLEYRFHLKWLRYFYMYGEGQNPKALLPQLEKAIKRGDKFFNMSKGEQLRDFLPIDKIAEYTIKAALQNKHEGIINICSGKPKSVRTFVEERILELNADIKLNLGSYPYPDYEPMAFWGNNEKLEIIVN